jgi:uncharacterized protein DUF4304
VIRADLAKRLAAAGYRKSGRTFFAAGTDHTRVVNVQGNRWNEGDGGSFAINLGVYFPRIAELAGDPPVTGRFPNESRCSVRERLGALVYDGRDHWWDIGPDTDRERLARSIGTAWSVFGRTWLDRVATLEGAYTFVCEQGMPFVAANFALALGDRDAAAQLLRRALAAGPRAHARFEAWARRHGVAFEGTQD